MIDSARLDIDNILFLTPSVDIIGFFIIFGCIARDAKAAKLAHMQMAKGSTSCIYLTYVANIIAANPIWKNRKRKWDTYVEAFPLSVLSGK